MEHESVKLGRINRAIEKALGVDLGENVWIYMEQADLDQDGLEMAECLSRRA
jgi:hypothetical protein